MIKQLDLEPYYKVLTDTNGDSATMLLYGYIGEQWTYDYENGGYTKTGITDIDFVRELNALSAKYPVIHVRLNGPGGDVLHGNAIMTAIQNCKAEVHTWNDGICASMAADIWMMGHRRHMAKNALLMIHAPWSICIGNAKAMRDSAETLDKMAEAVIIATASATGKTEDDVRAAYYSDYADHWLTYNEASADGLISADDQEYEAADLPEKVEKMTHLQLMKYFEEKNHPDQPGLMERAKAAFVQVLQKAVGHKSISITQPSPEMTLEEFKKSVADNTLSIEDAQAHLDGLKAAQTPAAPAEDAATAVVANLDAMKAELIEMRKQLAVVGAQPGAQKSAPSLPDGDLPTESDKTPDPLEEYNKTLATAAATGEVVRFTK